MKKKQWKKIGMLLSVGILTLSVAGCSKDGTAGSKGKIKILYTVCDNDDTFRQSLSEGMEQAASKNGVTLDMQLCGSNVDEQAKQLRNAKAEGYDAVICRLTDAETALQMEVTSNELPIVFVNNEPSEDQLTANQYVFVGSDEYQAGEYQADYVMKKLNHPSQLNVLIFEGEKGHSGSIGRTDSVKNVLKNEGVNANYVFCDFANWSDKEAAEKFEIFLKTNQSYDAIFCNNDTMALGVVNAMRKHKINPQSVLVTGVDATKEGCASIVEGGISFTVLQDAQGQADAAVKAAIAMVNGGKITDIEHATDDGKYIYIPFVPVDKSNVSQYQ